MVNRPTLGFPQARSFPQEIISTGVVHSLDGAPIVG